MVTTPTLPSAPHCPSAADWPTHLAAPRLPQIQMGISHCTGLDPAPDSTPRAAPHAVLPVSGTLTPPPCTPSLSWHSASFPQANTLLPLPKWTFFQDLTTAPHPTASTQSTLGLPASALVTYGVVSFKRCRMCPSLCSQPSDGSCLTQSESQSQVNHLKAPPDLTPSPL